MMPVKQLSIAVIGDEDLTNAMRLAGVRRYYAVTADQNAGEEARKALALLLDDPGIGIVAIQEEYIEYVGDLVTEFRRKGKMTPVVIEVPSKYGTRYRDITEYYKAYIRGFIGFDIEI